VYKSILLLAGINPSGDCSMRQKPGREKAINPSYTGKNKEIVMGKTKLF
jgi:hypothetical protein